METLKALIEDKPVLNIKGCFDSGKNAFLFETEAGKDQISLQDAKIKGLWVWRARFGKVRAGAAVEQKFGCGNFAFQFYVFDFSRGIDGRHALTQVEKEPAQGAPDLSVPGRHAGVSLRRPG